MCKILQVDARLDHSSFESLGPQAADSWALATSMPAQATLPKTFASSESKRGQNSRRSDGSVGFYPGLPDWRTNFGGKDLFDRSRIFSYMVMSFSGLSQLANREPSRQVERFCSSPIIEAVIRWNDFLLSLSRFRAISVK